MNTEAKQAAVSVGAGDVSSSSPAPIPTQLPVPIRIDEGSLVVDIGGAEIRIPIDPEPIPDDPQQAVRDDWEGVNMVGFICLAILSTISNLVLMGYSIVVLSRGPCEVMKYGAILILLSGILQVMSNLTAIKADSYRARLNGFCVVRCCMVVFDIIIVSLLSVALTDQCDPPSNNTDLGLIIISFILMIPIPAILILCCCLVGCQQIKRRCYDKISNRIHQQKVNLKNRVATYGTIKPATLEKCSICLMEYDDSDQIRTLTDCGHLYHKDCIDQWFATGNFSCPMCRDKV